MDGFAGHAISVVANGAGYPCDGLSFVNVVQCMMEHQFLNALPSLSLDGTGCNIQHYSFEHSWNMSVSPSHTGNWV